MKPYYRRHLYGYEDVHPRLLRLRYRSKLPASYIDHSVNSDGKNARQASSSRESKSSKDEESSKESARDELDGFDEQWRQMRKNYRFFARLMKTDREEAYRQLHEWIEKDPYHAFFGGREARGAWNPWAGFWPSRNKSAEESESRPAENAKSGHPSESKPSAKPMEGKAKDETASAAVSQSAKTFGSVQSAPSASLPDEFTIDPITLKKVPKVRLEPPVPTAPSPQYTIKAPSESKASTNIPVKKFQSTAPMSDLSKEEVNALQPQGARSTKKAGFASQPWLVREGFAPKVQSSQPVERAPEPAFGIVHQSSSEIEPSLNRLVQSEKKKSPTLKYNHDEKKTEDIDLLRASDVRAASGHSRKKLQPSLEEATKRRAELVENFMKAQNEYADQIDTICSSPPSTISTVTNATRPGITEKPTNDQKPEDSLNPLRPLVEAAEKAMAFREQLSRKTRAKFAQYINLQDTKVLQQLEEIHEHLGEIYQKMSTLASHSELPRVSFKSMTPALASKLEEETKSVKNAFERFENRKREHVDAKIESIQAATGEAIEAAKTAKAAEQARKSKDRELVREIRSIYEEEYGTIDTSHRQPIQREAAKDVMEPEMSKPSSGGEVHEVTQSSASAKSSSRSEVGSIDSEALPEVTARVVQELPASVSTGDFPTNAGSTILELPRESSTLLTAEQKEGGSSEQTVQQSSKSETPASERAMKAQQHPPKPSPSTSETEQTESLSHLYRVLAMDRVKQAVMSATTTSSLFQTNSTLRSASDILTHLDQPHKYFDLMETVEAQGYQLIAGTRNMLVYRKQIEQAAKAEPKSRMSTKHRTASPPLGATVPSSTTSPSAAASNVQPTQESVDANEQLSDVDQLAMSLKPWREEPVFSGRASPRNRFVRAYERAQRHRSVAEDKIAAQDKVGDAVHTMTTGKSGLRRGRAQSVFARVYSKLLKNLGAVSAILILLYCIGRWQESKAKKEHEVQDRDAEMARQRSSRRWSDY